ncbi:MAG: ComEC/Rec2 family competence protein [Clostridia bacterium]
MSKSTKKIYKFALVGLIIICVYVAFVISDKIIYKKELTFQNKAVEIIILDVGQADAIIIRKGMRAILIDSGESIEDGKNIIRKLENYAITNIEALILTHPHKDHIGGAVYVLENIKIKKIYMPNKAHTTENFEKLVEEIENQKIKLIEAKAGVILDSDGFDGEFLSPQETKYDDLNEYSAVLLLNYLGKHALFMGDAGIINEKEILNNWSSGSLEFLKIGHHGSNTASSKEFLKRLDPKIAAISCGKDNDYGHPHKEILEKLAKISSQVYRTDELGDLHFLWTDLGITYQQGE